MGAKLKVKKIGGYFETFSFSLREDNARVPPTYFSWHDGLAWDCEKIFVFADKLRFAADMYEPWMKVAILTEPRGLHPEDYEFITENHNKFHSVLTFDRQLLEAIPNGKFYPLGGSSIAFEDWGIYPKTKDVCMIVSDKNSMPGHKMRHEIVKEFEGRIDFYGSGVGKPFERKFDVLKDYKYCVVVESEKTTNYVSEKLIDACSVGCMPIYYGGKIKYNRHPFFYTYMIDNLFGIDNFLIIKNNRIEQEEWKTMVVNNFKYAKQYRIAEDWIYTHYPELFT